MISPSNTVTTLTRLVPGLNDPVDIDHLYPTGERNYVRTPPSSHLTAAPLARFAKQKGIKRLFLSWDRNVPYWATFASDVRRAAQHLGIEIAGAAPFDPEARTYEHLAGRIASTRADGIMLAANVPPSTRALLSDLRARLGPDVTLIGSEGFLGDLSAAEPAALGMYVAYPGADVEVLPPAGKRFLKDLEVERASRACSTPRLRRRQPRSCSTRSPAPMACGCRLPGSCSRQRSCTESSATSASKQER